MSILLSVYIRERQESQRRSTAEFSERMFPLSGFITFSYNSPTTGKPTILYRPAIVKDRSCHIFRRGYNFVRKVHTGLLLYIIYVVYYYCVVSLCRSGLHRKFAEFFQIDCSRRFVVQTEWFHFVGVNILTEKIWQAILKKTALPQ